jgi:hypothetical protein
MRKEYFELFFEPSSDYYLKKLESFENGKKFSFNPYVFLFGFLWFLYKKMHLEAIMLLGLVFIISMLEQIFVEGQLSKNPDAIKVIEFSTTIIFSLVLGFLGNYIYIRHAKKKISELVQKNQDDEEELKRSLAYLGGSSHLWVIIALVAMLIVQVVNHA